MLARLSLAGVSMFSAAGDRGSSDCVNNETGRQEHPPGRGLPGFQSPRDLGGGSRIELDRSEQARRRGVWSGWLPRRRWTHRAVAAVARRSLFERPWWQPKSVTKSSMRTVPDVVAHAAETPGWPAVTVFNAGRRTRPRPGRWNECRDAVHRIDDRADRSERAGQRASGARPGANRCSTTTGRQEAEHLLRHRDR